VKAQNYVLLLSGLLRGALLHTPQGTSSLDSFLDKTGIAIEKRTEIINEMKSKAFREMTAMPSLWKYFHNAKQSFAIHARRAIHEKFIFSIHARRNALQFIESGRSPQNFSKFF